MAHLPMVAQSLLSAGGQRAQKETESAVFPRVVEHSLWKTLGTITDPWGRWQNKPEIWSLEELIIQLEEKKPNSENFSSASGRLLLYPSITWHTGHTGPAISVPGLQHPPHRPPEPPLPFLYLPDFYSSQKTQLWHQLFQEAF